MVRKTTRSDIQRICASFTIGQIELIQRLVDDGGFGNNKSKVVEQIVLRFLDQRGLRS